MRRLRFLVNCLVVLSIVGAYVSRLDAQDLKPPVATVKPKIDTLHGDIRTDNYFWIRDKSNPDVIAYLNAENAYTTARMKHTEALQQKLYDEMLGRIKETDVSVPYRDNGYLYWNATEKGKSYATFMRRRATPGSPDEVVLDANALAVGKKFSQVGSLEVSPGGSRAAYLHDTTALRVYTLYVKDLATGKLLGDSISRVVPSIAWANDTVFFYQTADSARRSDAVWRHVLGTPRSSDVEVFHERDVLDNVGVGRTKSNKFIVISDDGFTSSESRVIPTANPFATPIVVSPRRANVEYQLDHIDGSFLLTTNDNARNLKVMRIADDKVGTGQWSVLIPTSDSGFIVYREAFMKILVVVGRSGGLRRVRGLER
jgi:oligopeptidase B